MEPGLLCSLLPAYEDTRLALRLSPQPTCPTRVFLEDTVLDDSVLEACQVLHYNVNEAGY